MWKRTALFLLIGCALLALVVAGQFTGFHEPSYQGRKLSEWLRTYSSAGEVAPTADVRASAEKAVRAIGTNALPCLLDWICYEPKPWQNKLFSAITQNERLGSLSPLSINIRKATLKADALAGFHILGPMAISAVPELVRLMGDSNTTHVASEILSQFGDSAVVPLTQMLTNANEHYRAEACLVLGLTYWRLTNTNVNSLISHLAKASMDSDQHVAQEAFYSLHRLLMRPGISIAAITNCLSHPDRSIRIDALNSLQLQSWVDVKRGAMPAISNTLHDSDLGVRQVATGILSRIEGKAPVRIEVR